MKKKLLESTVIFIFILLLELVYASATIGSINSNNILYIVFFTLNISLIISLILNLIPRKLSNILKNILVVILSIYYFGQFVFYKIFKMPFSFSSISMADQALDFNKIVINIIKNNYFISLIFLFIMILFIILINRFHEKLQQKDKYIVIIVSLFFISSIISLGLLSINKNKTYSAYNLYYNVSSPTLTVEKFGLLTQTNLDISRQIFGFKADIINGDAQEVIKEEPKVEYNIQDIDFEGLISNETDEEIKSLHEYFNTASATNKNEYTGYYKGKNLIVILAEGFNSIAVDKQITPTLYKMVNNSFVFNNFYSPLFLSTTGGEFQVTAGLLPSQETLKTWKSTSPNLIYSYGNAFKDLGYYVSSYHNWTYSYYNRDKTMLTQGFDNYLACGNGLEQLMNCKSWPTSDIDLINVTSDKYMDQENFMTFYITVSGHAEYNFTGNAMAKKNKTAVEDLPYSDPIKAYLATQIELDKALELLLDNLEKKGILDDTVIALVGDHYPYTLSAEQMNEISDIKRDEQFEVNRSNFILYNSKTPKTEVNKYAGNLDVLPTLLNLFGIDYDSRLIMGKDIFSNSEGLVIFSDHSWISDKGKYNATTGEFTPFKDKNISDDYVETINSTVANKFSISNLIIQKNYYTIIEESGN